jgi:hypothetical protein
VYVMACYCYGCPMNKQGVCSSTHQTLLSLKNLMHEFDGDNIIRQVCG